MKKELLQETVKSLESLDYNLASVYRDLCSQRKYRQAQPVLEDSEAISKALRVIKKYINNDNSR